MDGKGPESTSPQPSDLHHKVYSMTFSQNHEAMKPPPFLRSGTAIMNSDDPSIADLRAWAEDKQKHYPG